MLPTDDYRFQHRLHIGGAQQFFAAQVANQSSTVALNPARSGALNATYLTLYYAAGALGSAVAGPMVVNMGWLAICLTATLAIVIALFLSISSRAENEG